MLRVIRTLVDIDVTLIMLVWFTVRTITHNSYIRMLRVIRTLMDINATLIMLVWFTMLKQISQRLSGIQAVVFAFAFVLVGARFAFAFKPLSLPLPLHLSWSVPASPSPLRPLPSLPFKLLLISNTSKRTVTGVMSESLLELDETSSGTGGNSSLLDPVTRPGGPSLLSDIPK